jgi:2-iminoacetate synthase ThiH
MIDSTNDWSHGQKSEWVKNASWRATLFLSIAQYYVSAFTIIKPDLKYPRMTINSLSVDAVLHHARESGHGLTVHISRVLVLGLD